MRTFLFLWVFVILPCQAMAVERGGDKRDNSYKSIPIFENSTSDKLFVVLGKIHVKSSNLKGLSDKARKTAHKYGGDAVLQYQLDNRGNVSFWSGGQVSYAEGVVIKYKEDGILDIIATTPIPILE